MTARHFRHARRKALIDRGITYVSFLVVFSYGLFLLQGYRVIPESRAIESVSAFYIPSATELILDGKRQGNAPGFVEAEIGNHDVIISKPGYSAFTGNVILSSKQFVSFDDMIFLPARMSAEAYDVDPDIALISSSGLGFFGYNHHEHTLFRISLTDKKITHFMKLPDTALTLMRERGQNLELTYQDGKHELRSEGDLSVVSSTTELPLIRLPDPNISLYYKKDIGEVVMREGKEDPQVVARFSQPLESLLWPRSFRAYFAILPTSLYICPVVAGLDCLYIDEKDSGTPVLFNEKKQILAYTRSGKLIVLDLLMSPQK